jgi:hypothetical protein
LCSMGILSRCWHTEQLSFIGPHEIRPGPRTLDPELCGNSIDQYSIE